MGSQLTLTAAEWASVQPDGTLWLAREGTWDFPRHAGSQIMESYPRPPVEFVQTCAPCETCDDLREVNWCATHDYCVNDCWASRVPCPDCRIELVGPCPNCPTVGKCAVCGSESIYTNGTFTLGYAYAIGQPLPIIDGTITHASYPPDCLFTMGTGEVVHDSQFTDESITDRLAHYGPSETLVGRWALQLRVVQ